ncbi:MAG: DUF2809 domain-containing protein [Pseudomonadota bacterium]
MKYGGSVLWGTMVFFLVAIAASHLSRTRIMLVAAVIAIGVELFRLVHFPWLDAFRLTLPGALLLGRIFSVWNMVAYGVGIAIGALLDRSAWSVTLPKVEPMRPRRYLPRLPLRGFFDVFLTALLLDLPLAFLEACLEVFLEVFLEAFFAAFLGAVFATFFGAFFGAFLPVALEAFLAVLPVVLLVGDFVAAFRLDFATAFFAALVFDVFAVRFDAARFLRAGGRATGASITGSETIPSPASGM